MRGLGFFFLRYFSLTYLKLYARLLKDKRVGLWPKALVVLAGAYVIVPTDFLPDFLLVIGWVDDVLLLVLALINLVRSSPPAVVAEHLLQIGGRP